MIFIDWMSPPGHCNFNRALLSALQPENSKLYVFSELLRSEALPTEVLSDKGTRLRRAWSVFRLSWRYRKKALFFLSYDPIFVPWISLFTKHLFVFEHNTVPEGRPHTKHVIWQFLFTRGFTRCAQFPGQREVLRRLKQKAAYVGSPLLASARQSSAPTGSARSYFIVPSYRSGFGGLRALAPFVQKQTLVVKGSGRPAEVGGMDLEFVEHIQIKGKESEIRGVVVLGDSRVRGSGWFNDAIKFGIPVVITGAKTAALFEETFPGYPYVNVAACPDVESFEKNLEKARAFDSSAYVRDYNRALKRRVEGLLPSDKVLAQERHETCETRSDRKTVTENHDTEVVL